MSAKRPRRANLEPQAETLELLNSELSSRLARQGTAGAQVDTKAALLAGVAAAATQFLASRDQPHFTYAFFAYSSYAASFVAAVASYALVRYRDVPEPRGLVRECMGGSKAEALARLVATRVRVYEQNAAKHRRKALLWWFSVALLTLGLVLSVIAVIRGEPT